MNKNSWLRIFLIIKFLNIIFAKDRIKYQIYIHLQTNEQTIPTHIHIYTNMHNCLLMRDEITTYFKLMN